MDALNALRRMRRTIHTNCDCKCTICSTHCYPPPNQESIFLPCRPTNPPILSICSTRDTFEASFLCPKVNGHYQRKCIDSECRDCGWKKLQVCPKELEDVGKVICSKYEYVTYAYQVKETSNRNSTQSSDSTSITTSARNVKPMDDEVCSFITTRGGGIAPDDNNDETELMRSPLNGSEEVFLDAPLDVATAINDEYPDDDPSSSDEEDDIEDESYSPNAHPWPSSHQQLPKPQPTSTVSQDTLPSSAMIPPTPPHTAIDSINIMNTCPTTQTDTVTNTHIISVASTPPSTKAEITNAASQGSHENGGTTMITKTAKKLVEVKVMHTYASFMTYLKPLVKSFPQHKWIADHQYQAMKDSINGLKGGNLVSCWDYSENASLEKKYNVQAEHFSKDQVTLLICITYYWFEGALAKTVDICVSDDRKHSASFVHHCMDLHKDSFQAKGYLKDGDTHFVFSDGAPTHFKMVGNFWYVAKYGVGEGVRMVWNFFQSCHGKGEWE